MTDIVQILREMQQEEDCPMLVHMAFSALERSTIVFIVLFGASFLDLH